MKPTFAPVTDQASRFSAINQALKGANPRTGLNTQQKIELKRTVARYLESVPSQEDYQRAADFVAQNFKPATEVPKHVEALVDAYANFHVTNGFYYSGSNVPYGPNATAHAGFLKNISRGYVTYQDSAEVRRMVNLGEDTFAFAGRANAQELIALQDLYGVNRVNLAKAMHEAERGENWGLLNLRSLRDGFRALAD